MKWGFEVWNREGRGDEIIDLWRWRNQRGGARGLRVSILAGEGEAMVKEYGNFGFSELLGSVSFGSVGIEWGSVEKETMEPGNVGVLVGSWFSELGRRRWWRWKPRREEHQGWGFAVEGVDKLRDWRCFGETARVQDVFRRERCRLGGNRQ